MAACQEFWTWTLPGSGCRNLRHEANLDLLRGSDPAPAPRPATLAEVVVSRRWISIVGVVLWVLLVSQHAFYAVGLGDAQRALTGPAYVELRNAIDVVMRRNLPLVYVATLVWTIVLVARGGPGRIWFVVALVGLLADAGIMLSGSVPINELMQTWSPANLPADWEVHRAAWLDVFRWRQIAVAIGLIGMLLGTVR